MMGRSALFLRLIAAVVAHAAFATIVSAQNHASVLHTKQLLAPCGGTGQILTPGNSPQTPLSLAGLDFGPLYITDAGSSITTLACLYSTLQPDGTVSLQFTSWSPVSAATKWHLSVAINGGVGATGLSIGSPSTTVSELACSAVTATTCSASSQLATFTLSTGMNKSVQFSPPPSTLYVLADISIGGSAVNFTLTFTKAAVQSFVVDPPALTFSYRAGATDPVLPQTLSIKAPSPTAFTVAARVVNGPVFFLAADTTSGITPKSTSVSVQTGLSPGTYAGRIVVSAPGFSDAVVPVTLIVRPGITFIDPVPGLVQGGVVVSGSAPGSPAGRQVQGICADGISQILVSVPANSPNQNLSLAILNEDKRISTSENEDGLLFNLAPSVLPSATSSISLTATGMTGLAVYRAPIDFARPSSSADSGRASRVVYIQVLWPDTGETSTTKLTVLRPLVALIHGLWGTPFDWNDFSPVIYSPVLDVHRLNYDLPVQGITDTLPAYDKDTLSTIRRNALGFSYNASSIYADLQNYLSAFKNGSNAALMPVAAVQVDVIAHSMGGTVIRTVAHRPDFLASENYHRGIIHKLITIGTPHLGTPVASELLARFHGCTRDRLASVGNVALASVTIDGHAVSGAVQDLAGSGDSTSNPPSGRPHLTGAALISDALTALQRKVGAPIYMAAVAGLMSNDQLNGLSCTLCNAFLLRFSCPFDNLAQSLLPSLWPSILGGPSDSLVPLSSQLNTGTNHGLVIGPAVHSGGMVSLGFKPPDELSSASGVPDRVLTLLNTPVTAPVFVALP